MTRKTPSYRLHKASGQGFVELNAQRVYLGRHDLPETRQKYHQMIAEWEANRRQIPVAPDEITIMELVNQYRKFAGGYYCGMDGRQSAEPYNIKLVSRPVLEIYGETKAAEFGLRQLKTTREAMVTRGWSRTHVNKEIGRVRRMFRWAVEEGLVPGETWHALQAVEGLKRGRTEAHEDEAITSVADAVADAALVRMAPTVAAMVRIQRLTGMRPGEVCIMRTMDVERTGRIWVYRPAHHKTQHHGRARQVYIGPQAQIILEPWLRPDLTAYLFSPAQADQERRETRHAARKTPMNQGNRPGSHVKKHRARHQRECYDSQAFDRAIYYACDLAFPPPPPLAKREGETQETWMGRLKAEGREQLKAWRREHRWSSNQLRHSFATRVRREAGLEAAQVLLGHARADVTQIYAELDTQKGLMLAGKIG